MTKNIPVIILGAGGVGSALLQQIVDGRARVAQRSGCRFDVVGVADSRSLAWAPEGLSDAALAAIVARKRTGETAVPADADTPRPSDLAVLERAAALGLPWGIVVDVTAVSGMEPVIDRALELGWGAALANKKPFAGPWKHAQAYFNHPRVRHESTVGGGQPVIATLRYLLDTNDPVYAVEGQMSGTLGFICKQLDAGVAFSQAVADARARGYTEPDPRDDLGGEDVMRKVLILGRMAGWPLSDADITVESLYPPEMGSLSVEAFMAVLSQLDSAMRARVETAAAADQVLRYVAEVTPEGGSVGLKALPAASPLSGLKYISFHTARYDDERLLIGGKGAGVEMTAAGVLGDMIGLVREVG